ncbi:globin domain-containing protein [Algisphaera agarilytica]|uniref:Hemoglobin n=1 Tax=Algisphaera agarilytica TaxID=1385975 RepID=A0A7X0H4X1_9BACT|nr:globin [Algisphaera agarilytica]MBB6429341.1 hemoglobin [Algisphaera agarilytica]
MNTTPPTPDVDPFGSLYTRIGEDGFARLVAGFYERVKADDILGPMYPKNDWEGAEQRLRDFLVQRFGGPTRYSDQRGHPRLRMRHMPFAIDQAARDRWTQLMGQSLAEADLPEDTHAPLTQFFDQVATFMMNRS